MPVTKAPPRPDIMPPWAGAGCAGWWCMAGLGATAVVLAGLRLKKPPLGLEEEEEELEEDPRER
jgi:hypothetical protein